jgi:hypothetical protein
VSLVSLWARLTLGSPCSTGDGVSQSYPLPGHLGPRRQRFSPSNIQPVIGANRICTKPTVRQRFHKAATSHRCQTSRRPILIGLSRSLLALPAIKPPIPLCCCAPDYLSFECHSPFPRSSFVSNHPRSPAAAPLRPLIIVAGVDIYYPDTLTSMNIERPSSASNDVAHLVVASSNIPQGL